MREFSQTNHVLYMELNMELCMLVCVVVCAREDVFVHVCKSWIPSTQGFYRLGAALAGLERYMEALVAFARGLASDSKQVALLDALIETMLKSPFKGKRILCMPTVL